MNTKPVFEFHVSDQDESSKDEIDDRILNKLSPQFVNRLDELLNKKLRFDFNLNLNYQINQQFKGKFDHESSNEVTNQFSEELNHRLNEHLIEQNRLENRKFIQRLRNSVNGSRVGQNKLESLFHYIYDCCRCSFVKLNTKLIYLLNFIIYCIRFLIADVFHYFIFKFLFTTSYQRQVLVQWIRTVTNDSLLRRTANGDRLNGQLNHHHHHNSTTHTIKDSFIDLFANGLLLCGLVNHLNTDACPRYDLLDADDVDTNLELAYRLIFTYYGLDEKVNFVGSSNSNDAEQKLINLISKIRYLEVKRKLSSKYEIETEHIDDPNSSSLVQDNYLIRGMGLVAGVRNRVSFFNIFYFKFIDIVVELVGPDSTYGCKRIKVGSFKLDKPPKKFENNDLKNETNRKLLERNGTCTNESVNDKRVCDKIEIPLIFKVKKQLIEISYLPIRAGIHKISIIHQGMNILQSPYTLKVDDYN